MLCVGQKSKLCALKSEVNLSPDFVLSVEAGLQPWPRGECSKGERNLLRTSGENQESSRRPHVVGMEKSQPQPPTAQAKTKV